MMETTNERPAACADIAEEQEAQDSFADIAKMLETTNAQPATAAGTTDSMTCKIIVSTIRKRWSLPRRNQQQLQVLHKSQRGKIYLLML
jgi:hypothetical protein